MSTLRFVHIGDLHAVSGPKNADRIAALDYVIDRECQQPVSAWLFPGDVSDSGLTIDLRNLLIGRALKMADVAPLVIVRGNHDPVGDLDFFAKLRGRWPIYVVNEPTVIDVPLSDSNILRPDVITAAIACIPYPNKVEIVAAGTPQDQITVVAKQAFDAIFMELGHRLDLVRAEGRPTLAIGHVNISGSVASTGQPQIGSELEIDATHLARLGDCYIGFNHIHKHQRHYAGSLCRCDFGETEPKGYVVVDYDLGEGRRWLHRDRFIEVPVPPMYHVEATLTRDAFDWRVTKGPNGRDDITPGQACLTCDGSGLVPEHSNRPEESLLTMMTVHDTGQQEVVGTIGVGTCSDCKGKGVIPDFSGTDVRVRVRYNAAERDVIADALNRIKPVFAGARILKLETIAEQQREIRAPEVAAAQTLDEKLSAVARVLDVSWGAHMEANVSTLLATEDGDAVVAAEESRLTALAGFAIAEPEVVL